MNFISAMLLVVFRMSEPEAFAMLCYVIEDLLPDKYYTNTMLSSQVDQRVFSALVVSVCVCVSMYEYQSMSLITVECV